MNRGWAVIGALITGSLSSFAVSLPGSQEGTQENGAAKNEKLDTRNAVGQNTMEKLAKLAIEPTSGDPAFLGRTRFEIIPQSRLVLLDLRQISYDSVVSKSDPYSVPLEALVRVEVLRRDFQRFIPEEKFWLLPLFEVEHAVKGCIDSLESPGYKQHPVETHRVCAQNVEEQFGHLHNAVVDFAKTRNLKVTQSPDVMDPVAGYRIQVSVDPPSARVRVMTFLEYEKCKYFKQPLEESWNDLLVGENYMIGRYRYLVEWPVTLNGPEEGEVEVTKPGTMIFTPKSK